MTQPTLYEKNRFLFSGYGHAQEMKFKEVRRGIEESMRLFSPHKPNL